MSRIPPDRAGYTDFTCTGSEGCPIEALPTTCETGTIDNYKNLPAAVVGNVNNVAYNDLTLIEDDTRLKAFSTVCNGTYDPFKGLFIDMYKSFTDNGLSALIDTSCMDEYPIGYLTPLTPLSLLSAGGSGSGGSSPSGPKCTYLVEYNWECLTQTWRLENVDTFGSTLTTGSWIGAGTWNITRLIVMDDDFTGSCATWNDAWAGAKPAPTRTDCTYCEWVFTATFDCDTKEWHIDNSSPSPSCNVSYMPENWTLTDCFKARKVTRRITSPCDDASNSCQTAVPYEDPSEIDSYITKPECNKCFVEIKADWNCDTDEWEIAAQPAHCLSPEEGNEPHDWEQSDPDDDKHATKLVDTGTACTPTNENCGCTEPYEPSPDDKPVWSPQDCNRCMWKFTIHYNCNENEWDAAQGLKFCESTEDEPEHDWEEDSEDHKIGYKTMYVEGDCTTEAGCTAEKPDPGEPGWDPSLLCKKCAIRYEAEYDCDAESWTVYEASGGKVCQDADIEGTGWELIDPDDDKKMQRTIVLDYNCREDGACNDQSGDPGQPTAEPICDPCETTSTPGAFWVHLTSDDITKTSWAYGPAGCSRGSYQAAWSCSDWRTWIDVQAPAYPWVHSAIISPVFVDWDAARAAASYWRPTIREKDIAGGDDPFTGCPGGCGDFSRATGGDGGHLSCSGDLMWTAPINYGPIQANCSAGSSVHPGGGAYLLDTVGWTQMAPC